MNILKKTIGVLAVSTLCMSSAIADSSAFRGIYVGVGVSANGIGIDGVYKDSTASSAGTAESNGSIGVVEAGAHGEIGYNLALGDSMFVSLGASLTPVDATVKANNVTKSKQVKAEISDLETYYIEPSVMISDNAALYLKFAIIEGDFKASGNDLDNASVGGLEGDTMGVGLKTVTDGGLFVKAEAGLTEFDTINITNIADDAGTNTATSQIDAEMAYGSLTVGFIF